MFSDIYTKVVELGGHGLKCRNMDHNVFIGFRPEWINNASKYFGSSTKYLLVDQTVFKQTLSCITVDSRSLCVRDACCLRLVEDTGFPT